MGGQFAWVTLATNDSYSLGALVLAHSLRRAGTKHDLAVLITPGVTQVMREKLATVFTLVKEVNVLDSKDEANLALLARPELGITFTKLHCWRLTEYEKCVFVDADALVIRNCDELFEREELTAAPDVGWPDCFNSGVFVFKPSQQTFASITAFAAEKGSFDGGDQGLLNSYFSDWAHKDIAKHLPFIYNMCSTATYSYLPAYKQFGENVRIIHFIGATKPWLQYFDTETGIVHPPPGCSHLQPLLQIWWNIFCDNVHPQLSPVMARSTLAPIWHRFTPSFPATTSAISQAPIYDDSSHSYPHHGHSYRSEIRKPWHDEPREYEHVERSNKPADFSEFHDPWDEYVTPPLPPPPPPPPPPTQNQQSLDNYLYHEKRLEPSLSSSSHSEQYYDIISTHVDNSEHKNWQNQFSNHDRHQQSTPFILHDHGGYAVEEKEEGGERGGGGGGGGNYEDRNKNYWRTDDRCDKESFVDYRSESIGGEENRESSNNLRNVINYDQTTSHEVFFHRQTTTNYSTGGEQQESHNEGIGTYKPEDHERDRLSRNFILGEDNFSTTDTLQTEARERSNISQSFIPSPELNCTAHPTPMHDLVRHNEQTVENQGHLAIDDAGIAGALAKMTLGEPRTSEQIALEEHMRRQGWEQGQIDYMGQDSFENIWKKICNTLSQAPPRQPSPPKDTEDVEYESPTAPVSGTEPESTEIPAKAAETTEEISSLIPAENEPSATSIDVVDDAQPTKSEPPTVQESQFEREAEAKPSEHEPEVELEKTSVEKSGVPEEIPATETDMEIKTITETTSAAEGSTTTAIEEKTLDPTPASVSTQIETSVDPLEVEAPKPIEEQPPEALEEELPKPSEEDAPKLAIIEPEVEAKFISTYEVPVVEEKIPESIATPEVVEAIPPIAAEAPIDPVTSPISPTEASVESPELILDASSVPIQVAESVLQSEPKELVSVEQSPVSEEAVSSVVASVLGTATAVSETVAEPRENEGQGAEVHEKEEKYQNGSDEVDAVVTIAPAVPTELPTAAPVLPELEQAAAAAAAAAASPKTEEEVAVEPNTPEAAEETEVEASASGEEPSESSKSASLTPPDSPSTVCPVRPARTRDPRIPTTPTVTEATPPNSPPIGAVSNLEDQPKTVKKVVRKVVVKKAPGDGESAESVEGETPGKKVVKKMVKKVVKKPKEPTEEGGETSGAVEKPKKVVKVVKKIVKPTESLDVDASVPETPPAGSATAPVPPKRKTKTSTTTTTTTTKVTKSPRADGEKPSESEP